MVLRLRWSHESDFRVRVFLVIRVFDDSVVSAIPFFATSQLATMFRGQISYNMASRRSAAESILNHFQISSSLIDLSHHVSNTR